MEQVHNLDGVVAAQRSKLDELRARVSGAEVQRDGALAEAERLRMSDAGYREARDRLEKRLQELEAAFPAGGDESVTIEKVGTGYKFVVQGEVLFGSGEAELTEEGRATMKKIAEALKGRPESVRVEGHTDNRPVSRAETMKRFPLGNLYLSLARALHAADALLREGVEAKRVSCAGYGEHRPRADNGTDEGRRRNRRVEILVGVE